jgi:hypothetical protein
MDGEKLNYAAYIITSLLFYVLADGLMSCRNMFHSTVQCTTKIAVLDGSCSSVPISACTLCPASLVSVLMGWRVVGFERMDMTR